MSGVMDDGDDLLVFDPDGGQPLSGAAVFADPDAQAGPPPLYYRTAEEWVREWLAAMYLRPVINGSDRVWCPFWWEHAEAVSRIEALWRAWEHLRLDPKTGMAVWWKDYADPHMNVLMDPRGPFTHCDATGARHAVLPKLVLADPGELFTPQQEKKNVFQRIKSAVLG